MSGEDLMTTEDVAEALGRKVETVRRFARIEGLMLRRDPENHRRLVISRADFQEWATRPEIVEMLACGDRLRGRSPRRTRTPRAAVAGTIVAAMNTVIFASASA